MALARISNEFSRSTVMNIQCYHGTVNAESDRLKHGGGDPGDLLFPTIFNIVVDAVLQATFMEVCAPQEA